MLINLSNHPHSQWDEAQKQAAQQYGECIDLPFPAIDPQGDEAYIDRLTDEYRLKIKDAAREYNAAVTVHLMGEMTFTYSLLEKLKQDNIPCIAATSERNSVDLGNGQKEIQFTFSRFRNYFY